MEGYRVGFGREREVRCVGEYVFGTGSVLMVHG